MRFATILEDLGVELVKAVITLIAFLPILFQLSKHVPVLPIVGELEHSLVWAAIVWSILVLSYSWWLVLNYPVYNLITKK